VVDPLNKIVLQPGKTFQYFIKKLISTIKKCIGAKEAPSALFSPLLAAGFWNQASLQFIFLALRESCGDSVIEFEPGSV